MQVSIDGSSISPTHEIISSTPQTENVHLTEIANNTFEKQAEASENPQREWGEVTVLVGTSTAGKSSIISELRKYKPNIVESGVDQSGVRILLEFFEKSHPEEMKFIYNIFPSENPGLILDYIVHGDTPVFKESATAEDKERFSDLAPKLRKSYESYFPPEGPWRTIENIMMDEVLVTAKSGTPVIFDVLQIKKIVDHALFNDDSVKPKIALVYCPFQDLAERVVGRNNEAIESGNLGDVRPGVFPLEQFIKLFRPAQGGDDEVVQTLTYQQAEDAFDKVFESGKAFMEEHSPDRLEGRNLGKEKAEKKAKILKKLGFEVGDPPDKVVKLTPKFKGYNILINTQHPTKSRAESVKESVQQILFDR